jgi:hypothetical protein
MGNMSEVHEKAGWPGLAELNRRLHTVLGELYGGIQSKMMDDLGEWTQSTFNRALELSSDLSRPTLYRHNKKIAEALVRKGFVSRSFILRGERPLKPETAIGKRGPGGSLVENSGVRGLPIYSIQVSNKDGKYATKRVREGTYYIDRTELNGVRPSEAKDNMFVIEVEGKSMAPFASPGDRLIIKPVHGFSNLPDDSIYLFRVEDQVRIKSLQTLPGRRLSIKSQDDNYDDYRISLDEDRDLEMIGIVWGRFDRLA